ncbi:MAG: hypothetical protein CLLPBCKN_008142 [Chroococcidiopsis cubana SAG 39.79]|nr:hypothetical protein [Chroococcidiopsis cubana SAG 39.79]
MLLPKSKRVVSGYKSRVTSHMSEASSHQPLVTAHCSLLLGRL